jgi:hypothetical protein
MRLFLSVLAIAGVITNPVLAQTAAPRSAGFSSADLEKGINEAAASLESLSRIMAIMGPGMSSAMQAGSPGLGRAIDRAQPSLQRALHTAQPQLEALGSTVAQSGMRKSNNGALTGADMARSMQGAASNLEALSRILNSVAPDLGNAYDAASPELKSALAQARPALEEAIKAAEPELRRLGPKAPAARPAVSDTLS